VKLSVISPTYNEAGNIVQLIQQLEKALDGLDYEIIISDDNSPDLTWALVEEVGRCNARVRLLRRVEKRGLGPSIVDGFSCARGEVVACIDADLQHDPAILPAMLKNLIGGSDLVIGSRYTAGGSTGKWGWLRRLESVIATKMAQWTLNLKMCDPMSGYFMMWRSDFTRVREKLNVQGFKILLEIAAHLKPRSVCEVAYTFRTRTAGHSKLSGKVVYAYLVQLLRLSRLGKRVPAESVMFALVGGSGLVVNLGVVASILHGLVFS
jgi:dolichol-phosphate mannosyltransferase